MDKYITMDDFRDMMQTREKFLQNVDTSKMPPSVDCGGVSLPPAWGEIAAVIKDYEVREDDVWLVSYPKAGTTWTQEIISAVMHDGNLEEVNKRHTVFRVTFLEFTFPEWIRKTKNLPPTYKVVDEMASPRVIKTHLPGHTLPSQIWQKKPKIIYVIRNPKDVAVSYFNFSKITFPTPSSKAKTFDEFFEDMNSGRTHFGCWWEHYLYFWKRRHEPNILLLRFEDLKRDLRGNVEKVSRFLGKDLSAEKLDAITEHCTFANMKSNPMTNPDTVIFSKDKQTEEKQTFMRKGKVGDWKNYFTVAQNEAMDAIIREKLHGTGLVFEY